MGKSAVTDRRRLLLCSHGSDVLGIGVGVLRFTPGEWRRERRRERNRRMETRGLKVDGWMGEGGMSVRATIMTTV